MSISNITYLLSHLAVWPTDGVRIRKKKRKTRIVEKMTVYLGPITLFLRWHLEDASYITYCNH